MGRLVLSPSAQQRKRLTPEWGLLQRSEKGKKEYWTCMVNPYLVIRNLNKRGTLGVTAEKAHVF